MCSSDLDIHADGKQRPQHDDQPECYSVQQAESYALHQHLRMPGKRLDDGWYQLPKLQHDYGNHTACGSLYLCIFPDTGSDHLGQYAPRLHHSVLRYHLQSAHRPGQRATTGEPVAGYDQGFVKSSLTINSWGGAALPTLPKHYLGRVGQNE